MEFRTETKGKSSVIGKIPFFLLMLCCLFPFTAKSQDTIEIENNFSGLVVPAGKAGILLHQPWNFSINNIHKYHFFPSSVISDTIFTPGQNFYFRFVIRNNSSRIMNVSLTKNTVDSMNVYVHGDEGEVVETEKINIRGGRIHGRIQIKPGKIRTIYAGLKPVERSNLHLMSDLEFRLLNNNRFLQQELSSRFIDSLLIGLLLFSALLNLILGLILKRHNFISLFFYLLSLVLFSISFLGFYDEFMVRHNIHVPISLPSYFLTLVLFLQVSKQYLQLEKHLPGWNTVTNVLMFFLLISIPYYYLTVYIEKLYNSFLAFSSLFFFVTAGFLGLIESLILFRKEPKAKYFLIANVIVISSLIINAFLDNKYMVVIGSVIQGFIFTIGLAEEIKLLDRQKLRFQQRYINQLEVNLRLKDKLTSDLEKKVEERTKELKLANEMLVEKNYLVERQKELLEIRSKEIKDSIEYAKRIQNASFPSHKILEKISRDYFIMYKPRDIVSGDFYWFGEVDDKVIIIASDCTGHGVPGAFMSMYGIAFLNEIINKEKIYRPDDILNILRDKIAGSLNRGDNKFETMDGMDMAVITIDQQKENILFAGANNPMYLIRNRELQIIKADKMPVAYYQKMDPFSMNKIEAKQGDVIYIFTDGIIDQFGGDMGKKFLSKRLKDVLLDIYSFPMNEQLFHLEASFNNWKGDYFQVDDVLMVGLRL